MVPGKLDLDVWRGSTFEIELVGENEVNSHSVVPTGQTVPYAEYLKQGTITYEPIDFLTLYDSAALHIRKPWIEQAGSEPALYELSTANGLLELTATSVRLRIPADDSKYFDFDTAVYDLELYIDATNTVDKMVYGSITVHGEKTV